MTPYRLKVKTIITISGIAGIAVFAIVLLLWHKVSGKELFNILIHFGLIILPLTFLWWLLEKYMWHYKTIQKFRQWLNIPPDFRGRWEGNLIREGEANSHDFVLEIKQTLSKIWVYTYSKRSSSISYVAEIVTDDGEHIFKLCYLWHGEGGDIEQLKIQKSEFDGYSMLVLYENETPKRISGNYFTNRVPQTKGTINLTWKSKKLNRKFI